MPCNRGGVRSRGPSLASKQDVLQLNELLYQFVFYIVRGSILPKLKESLCALLRYDFSERITIRNDITYAHRHATPSRQRGRQDLGSVVRTISRLIVDLRPGVRRSLGTRSLSRMRPEED